MVPVASRLCAQCHEDEKKAADKADLHILTGPNGSGKTTFLRVLCGLLTPDAGSGSCLGYDIRTQSTEIKKRVGYMTQRFSLYNDLTVLQNLRFFGGIYGLRGDAFRQRERWAVGMSPTAWPNTG